MRILITGGSGFIGTNVCEHFMRVGMPFINVDINAPKIKSHHGFWRNVDICDGAALDSVVREFSPNAVVHLAARTDLNGLTLADYKANTVGVENVINAMRLCPSVQRVVFASSRLVCRIGFIPTTELDFCPSTIYGESKVYGENIVRSLAENVNWSWTIVRPTSIWGPWFGVPYRSFFDAVSRRRYIHPRGVAVHKSFGFVGNTVDQLMAIAKADRKFVDRRVFYLADYPPVEVRDMSRLISHEFGVANPVEVPFYVLKWLAKVGDTCKKLGWDDPPLTSFRLANLVSPMVFDLSPLRALVGPMKYSLAHGIQETVSWMRDRQETS